MHHISHISAMDTIACLESGFGSQRGNNYIQTVKVNFLSVRTMKTERVSGIITSPILDLSQLQAPAALPPRKALPVGTVQEVG
jgi:hypothetical protein